MSRLGEALDRLERAVARLEALCTEGRPHVAAEGGEAARQRVAVDEIAARVDGALARIGHVLGEG
jgi:hypothetical protein